YSSGTLVTIADGTIANNAADDDGGGLLLETGMLTLVDSSVNNNEVRAGTGNQGAAAASLSRATRRPCKMSPWPRTPPRSAAAVCLLVIPPACWYVIAP
ncbi:MAG: hypothetical protein HC876_10260, partial [Chloroflexaceae bacterium]|nr:hypothetical protein [Chloroflexaceae bacterium]